MGLKAEEYYYLLWCVCFAYYIFAYMVKKLFLCSWISCVDERRLYTVDKVSGTS